MSDGLESKGADVPANESEGTYTGGSGGHCKADSGTESLTVLFVLQVPPGEEPPVRDSMVPKEGQRGNTL